jgi:acetyl esterase/lipase
MTRTNFLQAIVGALLLVSFGVATQTAPAEVHKNVRYAQVGDIALHLDLYLPEKSDSPSPFIVWIHGGAWRKGSKDRCPFAWMTEHAYAVASVQYRLTDKASFPAQIHDCKGAIRWLRAHADDYGYNAEKVGVAGISAGGHLVALLGTSGDVKELEGDVGGNLEQSSRVQAVLDMCGPSDFLLRLKNNPKAVNPPDSPVAQLLGGPASERQDAAQLASPAHHVSKDDPPLLIYHGTKDPLVSPSQSEHLRTLYLKADLEVTLELIRNGGHVPKEFWDKTRREMALKFFDKHVRGNN